MPDHTDRRTVLTAAAAFLAPALLVGSAHAASASEIELAANNALGRLYAKSDKARQLRRRSKGILIFPKIAKAGFVFGAEGGNGVMHIGAKTAGYYNLVAASFGLQAGIETFSSAFFFVTQSAVDYLANSKGWSIGAGPSVAIVDAGFAKNFDTTTLSQDVYAFPFGLKGLMAGVTLNGSKISHIHPGP